jgi:hypothetical protein
VDAINTAAIATPGSDVTVKPPILRFVMSDAALQPVTDQEKGRPICRMSVARIGGEGALRLLQRMRLRKLAGLQSSMEGYDQIARSLIANVP